MQRQKEFDEMTLITEESTINEPQNMAKKEEYLQELHRQINGDHRGQPHDGEFQFYPGKTNNTNQSGTGGAQAMAATYQADGGIGPKQDSVMTVTIDGTVHAPLEQASVMEQLDHSPSRFGGSLVDESFAAAARANMLDQDVAQSQHNPAKGKPLPDTSNQEVDFQNSELPIETEPASPKHKVDGGVGSLDNTAKVIKQRPFLRATNGPEEFTPERPAAKQVTMTTPLQLQVRYDDEEDIIEQTFGIGDDQQTSQVFQDLPTPKSRMKREIDIEKDMTAAAAAAAGPQGAARKKIFDESNKRQSETKVIDSMWDVEDTPGVMTKSHLYAVSQKNIETAGQQPQSPAAASPAMPGGSPGERPEVHETPVDVQNLASYFDKMQVGKKANLQAPARPSQGSNTIGSSEQKQPASRQHQSRKQPHRPNKDSNDFNNLGDAPPNEIASGEKQARMRVDSSESQPKSGTAQNSKQAVKYQMPNERSSRQGSRTGSPQKKSSLALNKQRETLESTTLHHQNTPTLKDPQKNLGLKGKLDSVPAEVDPTTKKMIIGYQQLKRRKQGQQTQESPSNQEQANVPGAKSFNMSDRLNNDGGQASETKELVSVQSAHGAHSPDCKLGDPQLGRNQALALKDQASDQEPPTQAQFQVGIVGYHEKRQRSDLENELEASLQDKKNNQNLTEAFNSKQSWHGAKPVRQQQAQRRIHQHHAELEIGEKVDHGIASDFEGNLTQEIPSGTLRTRKLYSQQKRGTRKKILASALKKNKEFKEKTNTIEHIGGVSRGLDSNFQIEGRRLMDQIEIDNQSGGTQGNLLHNVDDLADGFNGSNFDMQSVQGYSQNQYGGRAMDPNTANTYGMAGRVLSHTESNQVKRLTQMHQYQMIKGAKPGHGYFDGQNLDARPLSHGQNQFIPGDYPLSGSGANGPAAEREVLNSIEMMRNEYLNELPKSINIHSNNSGSAQKRQGGPDGRGDQVHHDVSFKMQQSRPIPPGKPQLETVPAGALLDICKYLKPAETLRLTMASKTLQKRSEEPGFDSLWVLFSFQTLFSKTGLTGIKNASQRRIDEALHQMHFQCESIRRDSKEVQVSIFEKWVYLSLVMVMIALPALLIISLDFEKKLSLQILMLPVTVAWGFLMLAQIYAWYRINKYYKRVITLHLTQPQYRLDPKNDKQSPQAQKKLNTNVRPSPTTVLEVTKEFFQKAVRGRNAKHCSLYTFGSFINRFAMMNMIGLTFMYLGFFLKIYVFADQVTYLQIAPISVSPLLLMYVFEMLTEVAKDRANWRAKHEHVKSYWAKLSLSEKLSSHRRLRCKINCGLIPNFILFSGYHVGFFSMLCLRLDGEIGTSFFIILIPLWVFLLYISAFLVISGLASTNQRVNKCERICLSVLVPIGFILTIIMGLMLVDEVASYPIYVMFIPLVSSIIFSYLYVRCLIKPSKVEPLKVKPEERLPDPQRQSFPAGGNNNSMALAQQLAKQLSLSQPKQMSLPAAQAQPTIVQQPLSPPPQLNLGGQVQIGQGSGSAVAQPQTAQQYVSPNQQIQQIGNLANYMGLPQSSQHQPMFAFPQHTQSTKPPLPGAVRSSQNGPLSSQGNQSQPHAASQQALPAGGNQVSMQQFQVKHAFY